MIAIHKEGYTTLFVVGFVLLIAHLAGAYFAPNSIPIISLCSIFIFFFFIQFFRNPRRTLPIPGSDNIYAPADGKIVAIETTRETEYFNGERIQISIFMSAFNVHVNRAPIEGKIEYFKYHKGKYLMAWHPKSSEENERTSVAIKNHSGTVLMRQIAGFMARRIVFYPKLGDRISQGEQIGFIKFGSRVDLLLPTNTEILTQIGATVTGGESLLARLVVE